MDRLSTAVYYSAPSVLSILIFHIFIPDRAFKLAGALGKRTTKTFRSCLSGLFLLFNIGATLLLLLLNSIRCQYKFHALSIKTNDTLNCAVYHTATILLLGFLLYSDRLVRAFLQEDVSHGISWRCMQAALVGCSYTILTRDSGLVSICIFLAMTIRLVVRSPESTSSMRRNCTRAIVGYLAVCCVDAFYNRESLSREVQRAYAVALASALITFPSIS